LAGGKAAPGSLANLVEELAGRLEVRPPVTLLLPGIASPFVWSLGRTKLLWPEELQLADDCRRSVLLHELAHLRRRDHWVGWLQLVGGCIWWWNPLFWLVCRQLRENAELACDAWVVQLLPEARRAYAEALIQVTQNISQRAVPVAAFGLGNGRRREFERRLTMIMKECVPCRVPVRALVVIGLLALAVLPGWTLGQPPTDKKTKPGTPPPPAPAPEEPKPTQPAPPGVLIPPPVAESGYPAPAISTAPVAVPPGFIYEPVTRDGVTFFQAVRAPGDQGGDRLEQIEQQLQGLLKEVQAMRKGTKPLNASPRPETPRYDVPHVRDIREGNPPGAVARVELAQTNREGGEVTLTRATYTVPLGQAQALAALLSGIKNEDIETKVEPKVEGDKGKITITTTPENQRLIAPFIALLNGQKPVQTRIYYRQPPANQAAPALR
jgi:hypothetical protein